MAVIRLTFTSTNTSSVVEGRYLSMDALTAWLVTFVFISFLIFASNLLTIVTFGINRHLRRHSVYCLLNLAIADMLHGLCSIFWYLVYLDYLGMDFFTVKLDHPGMNIAAGLVNTCTLVLSLVSLLLVSIDRMIATFLPFTHRTITSRTYIRIFVVTWCVAFGLAALPISFAKWDHIYGHDTWFASLHFLCIIFLIVIIFSYIAIFVKIRMKNNHHQHHQQEAAIQLRHKREKHLAMTLFIVTVLSLLTWLPITIKHELEYSLEQGSTRHNTELFTELVQLTNSLINPIVYVFRMKEFREALGQLLFRCSLTSHRVCPTGLAKRDDHDKPPSKKSSTPAHAFETLHVTAGSDATRAQLKSNHNNKVSISCEEKGPIEQQTGDTVKK